MARRVLAPPVIPGSVPGSKALLLTLWAAHEGPPELPDACDREMGGGADGEADGDAVWRRRGGLLRSPSTLARPPAAPASAVARAPWLGRRGNEVDFVGADPWAEAMVCCDTPWSGVMSTARRTLVPLGLLGSWCSEGALAGFGGALSFTPPPRASA